MTATNAKITSWGNSNGILLNKQILDLLHWKTNDVVKISLDEKEEKLVIEKQEKKCPPLTIEELFADYEGEYEFSEFDWGEAEGAEIW